MRDKRHGRNFGIRIRRIIHFVYEERLELVHAEYSQFFYEYVVKFNRFLSCMVSYFNLLNLILVNFDDQWKPVPLMCRCM